MKWKDKLINNLIDALDKSTDYKALVDDILQYKVNVHLAIFSEPFLTYLLSGKKTLESRLSMNRMAPFGMVAKGDIVVVKKSGGDICAIFRISEVQFYSKLNPEIIKRIDERYGSKILWNLDPAFLLSKADAKFLTLISISSLHRISGITTEKNDRGAWVTIRKGFTNTLFQTEIK